MARLVRPADLGELRAAVADAGGRGAIVRGLGRSYGDPAQNAGGTVIDLTGWDAILDLDAEAGLARVQAGVSIDRLLDVLMPAGLWLPVLPGTRQVTVGGAVCADVHGKNHHLDGSFGNHVRCLSILLASGDLVEAAPGGEHDDLFWATVGGMGLTGVVLEATLELTRIESSSIVVDTERARDVVQLLSTLSDRDSAYRYSVAWIDLTGGSRPSGRAVVTRGNPARLSDLPTDARASALEPVTPGRATPLLPTVSLVNGVTTRALNAVWFAKAPERRSGQIQDAAGFFHPLDAIGGWNRLYGRRGLCQYQFVMPFGSEAALIDAVRAIATSGQTPSLGVLKRLGAANASPMSFPLPGWTLAVDFPVRAGLDGLLESLDQLVLSTGGRVYLAKDSRSSPATIAGMYPRLDDFRAARAAYDPDRLFRSDLSRRLEL